MPKRWRYSIAAVMAVILTLGSQSSNAGLQPPVDHQERGGHDQSTPNRSTPNRSSRMNVLGTRHDAILLAGGSTVAAYFYAKTLQSVLDPPIVYPAAHEDRVRNMILLTLTAAAAPAAAGTPAAAQSQSTILRPLNVLEVGIGTTARLIRRDLYDFGRQHVINGQREIHLVGIDPKIPTSPDVLTDIHRHLPSSVTLHLQTGSICQPLLLRNNNNNNNNTTATTTVFHNGYFDAIICCFTLCSVDDPVAALVEMKRLLRPNGGTLGYCEHVAAPESSSFWSRQQILLDPLQQRLADHCHLHRPTSETIRNVFLDNSIAAPAAAAGGAATAATYLWEEDFLVPAMWPVSVQSCGVLQMTTIQP